MSVNGFCKTNLSEYLKELGKEYRKLNGKSIPAEITLVGGAAVLANYGFREMTYDIDALIHSSSAMKQAANNVGNRLNLPNNWLNADFTKTDSYSQKLWEVSVYYKTYSNILTVRTVSAEFLLAMKLMSGRAYKHDTSDITGILLEHQKAGEPISRERIERAIVRLYGENAVLPDSSAKLLDDAYSNNNLEALYRRCLEREEKTRALLSKYSQDHPDAIRAENIKDVINLLEEMEQQTISESKTKPDLTEGLNELITSAVKEKIANNNKFKNSSHSLSVNYDANKQHTGDKEFGN